jgi:uncharacterized protein YbjT (DUF2867 family)
LPFGTGKHAPIAGEDQARVIAKILLTPQKHKGQVYRLYGEKEYSFAEIAAEIGKVIGQPLGYEQVDAWMLKKLNANIPRRNYQGRVQVVTDTLWQHFEELRKITRMECLLEQTIWLKRSEDNDQSGCQNIWRRTEARFSLKFANIGN